MLAKVVCLCVDAAKLLCQCLLKHFDVFDAVHVIFLGFIGVCFRKLVTPSDSNSSSHKQHRSSSLRSPTSPGQPKAKKRGSVSFAAGTKFDPFEDYNKVGFQIILLAVNKHSH